MAHTITYRNDNGAFRIEAPFPISYYEDEKHIIHVSSDTPKLNAEGKTLEEAIIRFTIAYEALSS